MVKIEFIVPERGDIIRLRLNNPTESEQAGDRPALIISPVAYNRISNSHLSDYQSSENLAF